MVKPSVERQLVLILDLGAVAGEPVDPSSNRRHTPK
jgi:hypothetical protein